MTLVDHAPDTAAVRDAARRIAPYIRRTPTERSAPISELAGRDVFLKLENLQRTGAFKIRGALNAILRLDSAARAAGVITASAGNHGLGVAFAAKLVGVPACVVLPHGVPIAKLVAIQRSGAQTELADGGYEGAHERALALAAERRMRYVPAFDDDDVIAGQGTVALEVLEDADVDTIVVPVGGGGLVAGIAVAIADRSPRRGSSACGGGRVGVRGLVRAGPRRRARRRDHRRRHRGAPSRVAHAQDRITRARRHRHGYRRGDRACHRDAHRAPEARRRRGGCRGRRGDPRGNGHVGGSASRRS